MNIADQIAEFPLFPAWCDAQQSFACSSDVMEDFADWRVIPIARHRDSAARQRSNYRVALADLERVALSTGGDVYEFRSSHWAVGWTEILLVRGEGVLTAAAEIVMALADYTVLDAEDFSREKQEEADEVWRNCYSTRQRIEYIRDNEDQFEFRSFADMLGCVRGNYFAGCASDLIA